MNHKSCKFCLQSLECPYSFEDDVNDLVLHFCKECAAEYKYWKNDGSLASWGLYSKINEYFYKVSVSPSINVVSLFCISENEPSPMLEYIFSADKDCIKTFHIDASTLNPQNIKDKIRIWLAFL